MTLPIATQRPLGSRVLGFLRAAPVILAPGVVRGRWLAAHLVLLALGVGGLFWLNRDQWFFFDDWDFLTFGLTGPQAGLWTPHNQHWSTVPLLLFVPLRDLFGLSSYLPYITELIVLHAALSHVLWRVMLRIGCTPLLATAGASLFLLLGAGSDNILWAFQIGFVGSLLYGWAAVLILDRSDRLVRTDVWAMVLLVLSLMSSGLGVPVVVLGTAVAWARARSVVRPLLVGGIPTVVFGVWYLLVPQPQQSSVGTPAGDGPVALLSYVFRGLRDSLLSTADVPSLLASILILILAGWALVQIKDVVLGRPGAVRASAGLAGMVCAALFFLISGFGRAETSAPRYVYVAIAFALPGLVLALTQLSRRRWVELISFALICAVLLVNVQLLVTRADDDAERESRIRSSVMATATMIADGEPLIGTAPEPQLSPQATVDAIGKLLDAGAIAPEPVDQDAMARTRLALQVVAGTGTLPSGPGVHVPFLAAADVQVDPETPTTDGRCVRLVPTGPDPSFTVSAPGGLASLELTAPAAEQVVLSLADSPGVDQTVSIAPGVPTVVSMTLPQETALRMDLTGETRVCRLA